jgi:hypothetical protein
VPWQSHWLHGALVRPVIRSSCLCYSGSATREDGQGSNANSTIEERIAVVWRILATSSYSASRSETLKKFHSHVLPLSGEKA